MRRGRARTRGLTITRSPGSIGPKCTSRDARGGAAGASRRLPSQGSVVSIGQRTAMRDAPAEPQPAVRAPSSRAARTERKRRPVRLDRGRLAAAAERVDLAVLEQRAVLRPGLHRSRPAPGSSSSPSSQPYSRSGPPSPRSTSWPPYAIRRFASSSPIRTSSPCPPVRPSTSERMSSPSPAAPSFGPSPMLSRERGVAPVARLVEPVAAAQDVRAGPAREEVAAVPAQQLVVPRRRRAVRSRPVLPTSMSLPPLPTRLLVDGPAAR